MKLSTIAPLAALVLLTACSKSATPAHSASAASPAQQPVATVNGTPISRDLFEMYAKNVTNKSASDLTAEQRNELLDSLVRGEVVAQAAENQGLDKNADVQTELDYARLSILEQAGAEHYLADKKPTDQELQTEYDAQVAAMPKTQYHARHILVTSQAEAQQIIDQLKHGAKFDQLAEKDSIDSSKSQGGDLGWFSPTTMVKPFADAVASLKKGEITPAPVQTQYGWHVIQLLDTREAPVPPLDQVKDRVAQLVQDKKFRSYQDDLLKTAKVQKSL